MKKSVFVSKQHNKYYKLYPRFPERYIITNRRGSVRNLDKWYYRLLGYVSFVLCPSFIIREKEMA